MIRLVAALLVGVAVWYVTPGWRSARTTRLVQASSIRPSSIRPSSIWGASREDVPFPAGAAAALLARLRGTRRALGPAARRRAAVDRSRTLQALGSLAAELEAGQPPGAAIVGAGGEPSAWPAAVRAVSMGDDVAAALDHDAEQRPSLAHLAACWRVSAATGTGFAAAVTRLASSARAAEDVRVQLEAQLAGPRATARMLAVLPLVGIGFGMMLGSDPLAWLLTTAPGLMCLAAGLTLTATGMAWTGRIAASVERLL